MYGYNEIKRITGELYASASKAVEGVVRQKAGLVEGLKNKTVTEAVDIVGDVFNATEVAIRGVSSDLEGTVPEFLSSYSILGEDGSIGAVRLNIKTKLKAKYQFKSLENIVVDSNFLSNFTKTFVNAVLQISYVELAGENVDALNEYLDGVYEKENIEIKAHFSLNGSSDITSITDDEVVFNISTGQAHKINTLSIFDSGDAYADRCAALAYDEFVSQMKAIQIAPQLVKAKIGLITTLLGTTTKKRVDSILRSGLRKADNFEAGTKGFGKGYLSKKMVIDGAETTVFAIVENVKGEGIKTVLKPFDVKTMLYVDVPVESLKA